MLDVKCFDQYGNHIRHLTQWDLNQTLYVQNWKYDLTPTFHFCNKKSTETFIVTGEIIENTVKVAVPNFLLEQPYPIISYIYLHKDDSAKTVGVIKIPLDERPKPSDYEYVDNVEKITVSTLDARITNLIRSLSSDMTATEFTVELQDIRVSDDGTIYDSAGEAVRQQTKNIPNRAILDGKSIKFYKSTDVADNFLFDVDVTTLLESGLSLENLELTAEKKTNSVTLHMSDGKNVKSIDIPFTVDEILSLSSTNPVQNRIITEQINYIIEEIDNIKENGIGGGEGVTVKITNQNGTST